MAKNNLNFTTMVGENFEIFYSQIAKMILNCQPFLRNLLKFQMLKNDLSTIVVEKIEIYFPEMAKNDLKLCVLNWEWQPN